MQSKIILIIYQNIFVDFFRWIGLSARAKQKN